MPTQYRLCAIDLDDTLLGPDHRLSARSRAAVRAAAAAGVRVVIASGRMYATTLPTARELDLSTPVICYNGAMVKDPSTGETWMEASLPIEYSKQIIDYCAEKALQLNFYWQDLLYTRERTIWLDLYERRTSAPIVVDPDFNASFRQVAPTKLVIVDDPGVIDRLLPEMRDRFTGALYVTKSNAEYLEFLPLGADKGTALAFVATKYGISAAETVAFGDSWNDLPMLQWAGLSLAVGNAKAEVIAACTRTVTRSADDGVAIALEELFSLEAGGTQPNPE